MAAYFASPTYKAHTPSETFYADGRAYPDVAAFGQNVQVVAAGKAEGVSGTSCSAPIFAGECTNKFMFSASFCANSEVVNCDTGLQV